MSLVPMSFSLAVMNGSHLSCRLADSHERTPSPGTGAVWPSVRHVSRPNELRLGCGQRVPPVAQFVLSKVRLSGPFLLAFLFVLHLY